MRTFPTLPALALTTLALASGCGQVTPGEGPSPVNAAKATLKRSRDCNELTADLRADTIAKINKQIDAMIAAVRDCRAALGDDADLCSAYYGGYGGKAVAEDAMGGAEPPRSSGAPSAGGQSSGESGDFGAGAPSYSETNTQVQGVDEADIVKSDGQRLFVLHGSTFRVLQAYPLDTLGELGVTDIEGTPTEMYVEDGVAVIYSQVDGTPIYAAAGVAPPSRGYEGGRDEPNVEPPVAPGGGAYGGYSANPLTKITVLRIAPDFSTSVAKETYLEGSYLSSRRVDRHVRTVLQGQGGADLSAQLLSAAAEDLGLDENTGNVLGSLELVRTTAIAKVAGLGLDRWLPRTFEKRGGAVSAETLACGDAYTPTSGTTQDGLTQVSTLDLSNLTAATQEVAIFGQAGTVYGNAGALYVAASGYSDMPFGGGVIGVGSTGGGAVASPPPDSTSPAPETRSGNVGLLDSSEKRIARPELPEVITLEKTHVHKFTFSAEGTPVYVGSGTVDGSVKNQFSLDERDGVLRIATTEQRMYRSDFEGGGSRPDDAARPRSLTHVFALETAAGELAQKGAVKDLAPNEQIYSVRFVGAKAYVVTFRTVDPLFVLDFANPSAPSKLGELKIPGFSEYMHPLDENHLLTIGKEADENGRVLGLALQIFDVSNPTAPQQKQKFVYSPSSYGYSEASYNHKAFTYFAEKNLLAFPYTSYDQYSGRQSSTLELFKVGTNDGFTRLGGIDHSAFFSQQPSSCYYVDPSVRRGLFIEDVAYSISYGGVIAKRIDDLAGAGVSLALPSPYPQPSGGCGDAAGKPSGG